MGGKPPAPPAPPDPKETASTQTATNVNTAIANQQAGLINQITPYGTNSFNQRGVYSFVDKTDPDNHITHEIPLMELVTEFTPEGQEISDQNLQTDLNLATFGAEQSGKLNDLLRKPFDLSNDEVEGRIIDLQRDRMDPLWSDKRSSLEGRLSEQGIKRGTTAYDKAFAGFSRDENDAYNQMMLAGRGQALNEKLTQDTMPINQLIGITSGTQVQQPQFQATPSFNMPTTDYAGITSDNYNQRLSQWQAAQNSGGGFPIGGLFSALGSIGGAAFSDRRLKRDVTFLGLLGDLPIYAWRYIWGGPRHVGVMAQDMEVLRPDAVVRLPGGWLAVDYGAI